MWEWYGSPHLTLSCSFILSVFILPDFESLQYREQPDSKQADEDLWMCALIVSELIIYHEESLWSDRLSTFLPSLWHSALPLSSFLPLGVRRALCRLSDFWVLPYSGLFSLTRVFKLIFSGPSNQWKAVLFVSNTSQLSYAHPVLHDCQYCHYSPEQYPTVVVLLSFSRPSTWNHHQSLLEESQTVIFCHLFSFSFTFHVCLCKRERKVQGLEVYFMISFIGHRK